MMDRLSRDNLRIDFMKCIKKMNFIAESRVHWNNTKIGNVLHFVFTFYLITLENEKTSASKGKFHQKKNHFTINSWYDSSHYVD